MECTKLDKTDFRGSYAAKVQNGQEGERGLRLGCDMGSYMRFRVIPLDHLVSLASPRFITWTDVFEGVCFVSCIQSNHPAGLFVEWLLTRGLDKSLVESDSYNSKLLGSV